MKIPEPNNVPAMPDNVNHPAHYTAGKIECIDALAEATKGLEGIEAVCTANAIKYLWRWKRKNGVEDLKKAIWYVDHLINVLEPGIKIRARVSPSVAHWVKDFAEDHVRTFRDRLQLDHPEYVDKRYVGGCKGCPCDYDYEPYARRLRGLNKCADCWNRTMNESIPKSLRERVKLEHPDQVQPFAAGGVLGCPCDYGYEPRSEMPCNKPGGMDCGDCWDRILDGGKNENAGHCDGNVAQNKNVD